MNVYTLTLLALLIAVLAHTVVGFRAVQTYRQAKLPISQKRTWLALAVGSLTLALHHGFTLELALRTSLYDFRQAVLAFLAALCFLLVVSGFRRQPA